MDNATKTKKVINSNNPPKGDYLFSTKLFF